MEIKLTTCPPPRTEHRSRWGPLPHRWDANHDACPPTHMHTDSSRRQGCPPLSPVPLLRPTLIKRAMAVPPPWTGASGWAAVPLALPKRPRLTQGRRPGKGRASKIRASFLLVSSGEKTLGPQHLLGLKVQSRAPDLGWITASEEQRASLAKVIHSREAKWSDHSRPLRPECLEAWRAVSAGLALHKPWVGAAREPGETEACRFSQVT